MNAYIGSSLIYNCLNLEEKNKIRYPSVVDKTNVLYSDNEILFSDKRYKTF